MCWRRLLEAVRAKDGRVTLCARAVSESNVRPEDHVDGICISLSRAGFTANRVGVWKYDAQNHRLGRTFFATVVFELGMLSITVGFSSCIGFGLLQ